MKAARRVLSVSVIVLALGFGSLLPNTFAQAKPGPVTMTAPVDFGNGYVVDEANVLGSDRASLEAVIGELSQKTGITLFVAYVPDFDQPTNPSAWAEQTAIQNNLGRLGIVLAVAVDAREYGYSVDANFPLSDDQIFHIEQTFLIPELSQNRWAAAAQQFAVGIAEASGETLGAIPPSQPSTPGTPGQPAGISAWWLLVPAGAIAGGAYWMSRRGKGKGTATDPQKLSLKDLGREVSSALIELDDAIKLSEQELGFASAQFGEEASREFQQALATASEHLNQAFRLKQLLDDNIKDTEEQTRVWSGEILEHCRAASTILSEQELAFEKLRKIEDQAPALLPELQKQSALIEAVILAAEQELQQLYGKYDADALIAVAQNPQQAKSLLEFASARIIEAEQYLVKNQTSQAALGIRAAQQSLGQIEHLNTAISEAGQALLAAEQRLTAIHQELRQDLQAARSLSSSAGVGLTAELQRVQQEAESKLSQMTGKNPLTELAELEQQNSKLDQVFAQTQHQVMRQQRVQVNLERTIFAAESAIAEANQFLTTRRGGIGLDARTRLASAGQKLAEARTLQHTQPEQSLQLATYALQSAQQAMYLANSDVQNRTSPSNYSGNQGPDLGALLGGILGGFLGSSGGGWSGGSPRRNSSTWSGGWSSGGFGSSSGRSRSSGGFRGSSGGFSGGSRSSSRSSGGRRNGGGRF